MLRPGPREHIDEDTLAWAAQATLDGIFCLRALVLSIERGDVTLPIDPHAWENRLSDTFSGSAGQA